MGVLGAMAQNNSGHRKPHSAPNGSTPPFPPLSFDDVNHRMEEVLTYVQVELGTSS